MLVLVLVLVLVLAAAVEMKHDFTVPGMGSPKVPFEQLAGPERDMTLNRSAAP